MKRIFVFILTIVSATTLVLAANPDSYRVSYVSVDHVYIDAGTDDGLAVGDHLSKIVDDKVVAELELVYAARHSASCRLLEGSEVVVAGDMLAITSRRDTTDSPPSPEITAPSPKPETPLETPPTVASPTPPANPTRLFGSVSTTLYLWQDNSAANADYTRTSARLNLRVENLWREDLTLTVRTRGRYDVRHQAFIGGSDTEWRNRIWVLSLGYESPDAPLAFTAGRFLPQRLGNVGYIDGGMITAQVSDRIQVGLLGGARPEWAYNETSLSMLKGGGYFSYRSDKTDALYLDQSFGAIAESHNNTISRTFLAWRGSVRSGSIAGMTHSAEIDVNRGWRKEKAGKTFTISNLYVQTWYRASRALRVSLQYDNRQNYWTYEYFSLADSLFDTRVRQGLRGRVDLAPGARLRAGGSVGYRKTEGDPDPTVSYSGSVQRTGFFNYNLSLGLSVFGFNGVTEQGVGYTIRGNLPPGPVGRPYVTVGGYSYSVDGQSGSRSSTSAELGTSYDIAPGYYIGGSTEWSTGDDIDGLRFFLELGYRY